MRRASVIIRAALFHLFCLPADLLGLLVAVLLARGAEWTRFPEVVSRVVVVVYVREGSWLARRWPYSTTLGHVVLMHPDHGSRVLGHELVHVAQFEDACCSLWIALVAASVLPWWALPPLAWVIVYAGAAFASLLRGGRAYRDNLLERHARAETGA